MTRYDADQWFVARFVVETEVPLSIGNGPGRHHTAQALVVDANGLPTLPGSSIAGVLRQLASDTYGPERAARWFGRAAGEADAHCSQVAVSWGCFHDAQDRPIQGLSLQEDPLLQDARTPLQRDHVRIDGRGVAERDGHFRRACVRIGSRFSFEISWSTDERDAKQWHELLDLLVQPAFRLGGGTRSGLGALRLIRAAESQFDLRKMAELARLARLGTDLGDLRELTPIDLGQRRKGPGATLNLMAETGFRMGQGECSLKDAPHGVAMIPVTEASITWTCHEATTQGALGEPMALIPGSAIKGALRHRTLFHYHCLMGLFAEDNLPNDGPDPLADLFGESTDHQRQDLPTGQSGQVGRVLIGDLLLAPDQVLNVTHNCIDRFTGGVRRHMLYTEQLLYGLAFQCELEVLDFDTLEPRLKEAFELALLDLCEGRLALGAGAARGHGTFSGTVVWHRIEKTAEVTP